ncbi:MAG TPA: sigma-70 family RNA polymerase sigma factor [Planctomycetota bacterium]|nr:sigma-70 family RNA polymerase sigma factor [Planctomycetota bacterium]
MDTVEQLFARFARQGDVDALSEVFDRTAQALLRLAVQICGREAEAEDLLQATFLVAIEKARAFDPARSLTAWLVGILQKQGKSLRRRMRRELPAAHVSRVDDPGERVAAGEVREAVESALRQVDEPYRQPLHLRLLDGLSSVEIAQHLGRTPGAVRVQLHRGLARIRRLLPTGLAIGVAAHARGLAAVRSEVLAAANAPAAVGAGVLLSGGLLVKKLIGALVAVCLALALVHWWQQPPTLDPVEARGASSGAAAAVVSSPQEPAADSQRVVAAASEQTATARDDSPGNLRVLLTYADNGAPAADVPVVVDERFGFLRPKRVLRTNVSGEALFAVIVPRAVTVSTIDTGSWREVDVRPGVETVVNMQVRRGYRLLGRVVDEHGAPVPGAHIYERPPSTSEYSRTAVSDGNGRFELFPVGDYAFVGARASGGRRSQIVGGVPDSDRTIRIELVVHPLGADLAGRVVDEKGLPLAARLTVKAPPGDEYELTKDGQYLIADGDVTARTAVDGRFELLGLRAGSVQVQVASADHGRTERVFELAAGQWHEVTIKLAAGVAVFGKITDPEGRAIAGAYAYTSGGGFDPAFATGTGDYRLPGLTAGSQQVSFDAPGHREQIRTLMLPRGADVPCDVTLVPEPRITGTVVDATGAPVRCRIELISAGAGVFGDKRGRTDAEGRFSIPSPEGGQWQLRIEEDGAQSSVWGLGGSVFPSGTKDLVVTLGENEHASAWLLGRLADDRGEPVRFASLRIASGDWTPQAGTTDVADGSFRIGPLPPAEYRVLVNPRAGGLAQATLGPFALAPREVRDLGTVRLGSAGRLLVHKVVRDGGTVSEFHAHLEDDGGTNTYLTTEAEREPGQGIAPGQYRLHAWGDGFMSCTAPVSIKSGETARVELSLEPAERRAVRYPVPPPSGWSAVKRATVEVWRSGELVDSSELEPAIEPQQTRYLALGIGEYVVRLVANGGPRYEGNFVIAKLVHKGPRIDVAVSEVR